jgi:hypothetical protein
MEEIYESESDLETAILNFLVRKGLFVWRNNTAGIYDANRQVYRNGNAYSITGVSDILGILPNGQFLAIEVKHPKRNTKPTKSQAAFIDRINNEGGVAFSTNNLGYVVMKMAPFFGEIPQ